eukprot:9209868-Lingulodinium_polyedra.AAC.1
MTPSAMTCSRAWGGLAGHTCGPRMARAQGLHSWQRLPHRSCRLNLRRSVSSSFAASAFHCLRPHCAA